MRVDKRWGHELIIVNDSDAGYCGKMMVMDNVYVQSRVERHRTKDETFYVLEGIVRLELFGSGPTPSETEIRHLHRGNSFRITPGTWHRFGTYQAGTQFVEFSTFHDDSDTERYEGPLP